MRQSLSLLLAMLALPTWAMAVPKVQNFRKQSQDLANQVQANSSPSEKHKRLLTLQRDMEKAQKEYEKANPRLGGDSENDVNLLYFTLEPVFALAKKKAPSEQDCVKTQEQISADEGSPQADRDEALRWLRLFCD